MKSTLVPSILGAAGLALAAPLAHSGSIGGDSGSAIVLKSVSDLVRGNYGAADVSFTIPSAGELFVTLSDIAFPDPFSSAQFDLMSGTKGMLLPLESSGTMTFYASGPMSVYANVFTTSSVGEGLFNLTATFIPTAAPVSLPAAGLLFGSITFLALLLDGVLKRREHTTVTTAMA